MVGFQVQERERNLVPATQGQRLHWHQGPGLGVILGPATPGGPIMTVQDSHPPPLQSPTPAPTVIFPKQSNQKQERNQDTSLPALSTLHIKAHQISLLSCMWSRCQTSRLLSASLGGSNRSAGPLGNLGRAWAEAAHSWSPGWDGFFGSIAAPGEAKCVVLSCSTTSYGSLGPTVTSAHSSAWSLRPSR